MEVLKTFEFENITVRTSTDNDQTWFVGVDICSILGYEKAAQAIEKLDEDEKKLELVKQGPAQRRRSWMINESGLYSLILTSRKPEAKAFKRWITHDVIPAIRKAGRYSLPQIEAHEAQTQSFIAKIEEEKLRGMEFKVLLNESKKSESELTSQLMQHLKKDPAQLDMFLNGVEN